MTSNNEPLTLRVRQLRRSYREAGLTQRQLADLAGVSTSVVHGYEALRALPNAALCLLRVAMALDVSFEQLIAADVLDELRADVEARRLDRRLERESTMTGDDDAP